MESQIKLGKLYFVKDSNLTFLIRVTSVDRAKGTYSGVYVPCDVSRPSIFDVVRTYNDRGNEGLFRFHSVIDYASITI